MAGSPKKRERKERTQAFIHTEGALDAVCAWLETGKSLVDFCNTMDIPYTEVSRWLNSDTDRAQEYARARASGADVLADEILSIGDTVPPTNAQGSTDSGYVAWLKMRVDNRKWIASKLKPNTYGDKIDQNITGRVTLTVVNEFDND